MSFSESMRTACAGLTALSFDDVPAATIERAKRVIADTIAVAVGGAREPAMTALLELDRHSALISTDEVPCAHHDARVWAGGRAHPHHAAFLNATAGSFLELDEGMRPTGHPGMQVVPAALAAAEASGATGRELLRAVVLGYELSARLFRALRLRPNAHPHGHAGAIGAALAVGMIRNTDPLRGAEIAAALPLAATWQACYDGATARNMYMGHAASAGVRSSDLAQAGFTGSFAAFEVAMGALLGDDLDLQPLETEVDVRSLAIDDGYFKVHSACALTHTAIEAALDLRASVEVPTDAIREIRVDTISAGRKVDMQPATNDLSGRFSLGYAVATALVLGRSDPDAFSFDARIAELAQVVSVHTDTDLDALWPGAAPSRVQVLLESGWIEARVDNPVGHGSHPLDLSSHRTKFTKLIADESLSARWWPRFMNLEEHSDVRDLLEDDR